MDVTKAGLWDGFRKWGKILLWVAASAVANYVLQYLTGIKFHDLSIHGFVITDDMLNLAMTAFINGFFAGFVKWVTTKKDECIR